MTRERWNILLALTALAVLGRGAAPPATAQSFTLQDLGTLGGTVTQGFDVNNLGHVVGASLTGTGTAHAFLSSGGKMTDLGTLGGAYSFGVSLNDRDQVVGTAQLTGNMVMHAFLWDSGKMIDLGTLGGNSIAWGINNRGHVGGWSFTGANAAIHAFLWDNGKMTDLGTLGGPNSLTDLGSVGGVSNPNPPCINNSGEVVGASEISQGGPYHAFLYSGGAMKDLGTLGGTASDDTAVNELGQVIGISTTTGNTAFHAFLASGGKMTDLGTLGGPNSIAFGLNNLGQVVGDASTQGNAAFHAFLWDSGKMTDLGTLGGLNSLAVSINNIGQVVGSSLTSFQDLRSFHACYWDSPARIQDLNGQIAPGSGWELVNATRINDAGEVLGSGTFRLQNLTYLLTPTGGRRLTADDVSKDKEAIELILTEVKRAAGGGDGALLHLLATLSAAETRLVGGQTVAAANLLQAFIRQVDVLSKGGTRGSTLTRSDGQRWIDAAQAILTRLRP